MKTCKTCKETKTFDLFTAQRTRKGTPTWSPSCKACRTQKACDERTAELTRDCAACGTSWRMTSGEKRKTRDLCPVCYPLYRTAYQLVATAKHRSGKKKIDFDLDVDFVYERLRPLICEKTGLQLSEDYNGSNYRDRSPMTPSIDKIDPSKGYTKDNVQFVCWWYNLAKSYYSDETLLELCRAVVKKAAS